MLLEVTNEDTPLVTEKLSGMEGSYYSTDCI